MRDKRLPIDDAFINRAWDEMRRQLDVEMPTEENRRRRFGGYWWLAVLGFMVLTVGAGYAIWNTKPSGTVVKPINRISVGATPIASETGPSKAIEAHAANKVEDARLESEVEKAQPKAGFSGNMIEISHRGKGSDQVAEQSLVNAHSVKNLPELDGNQGINVLEGSEIIGEPKAIPSFNAESSLTATESPKLIEQPALDLFSIANPALDLPIEPFKQNGKRWVVEASYMHALKNPASGAGIGLLMTKPLKNKNFSLQFGLAYSFVQQPLEVELAGYQADGTGRFSEEVYFYGTSFDSEAVSMIPSNAVVRTSRQYGLNLHYLAAPIRLSCAFSKRFSMKIGLDAAMLLRAKSDFVDGGVLEGLSFLDKSMVADNTPGMSEENLTGQGYQVSPFDLVTTAGLEYRISKRFSLSSQVRYGLIDVLPKNSTADFNRLLQMSLTYHLPYK